MCYTQLMAASLPTIRNWLPLQLGLCPQTVRPRHLEVVGDDREPGYILPVLHLGANALGVQLLDAKDRVDLEMRLDDVISNPLLSRVLGLLGQEIDDPRKTLSSGPVPTIENILPEDQVRRLDRVELLYAEWTRLRKAFLSKLAETGRSVSLDPDVALMDVLYDPSIPPTVALLHLASFRGEAASLGLFAAAVRQVALPGWLAEAFTDFVTEGIYAGLRVLGSIPELNADPNLLPIQDRLPLQELLDKTEKAERGAQMLTLLAEAQGELPRTPWPQTLDSANDK